MNGAKREIVKPIAQEKPKVKVIDFYQELRTSMKHPITDVALERLGENWVLHVDENLDVLHPSEYTTKCGMDWDSVMQFVSNHESFKKYYDRVMQILGVRRERRMIEANPSKLDYTLPQYLKEYATESERRSKLKVSEQLDDKRPVTVVIRERRKSNE